MKIKCLQKSPEKQKLNLSRSALFDMKTRVCRIYFESVLKGIKNIQSPLMKTLEKNC